MTLPVTANLTTPAESLRIKPLVKRLAQQHALYHALLGQIGALISASDAASMLSTMCHQLLASGLLTHAWVGQVDPNHADELRIIASGDANERLFTSLTTAQKHNLKVHFLTVLGDEAPARLNHPNTPLEFIFQQNLPAGFKRTTFLIPLTRFDHPWAVLLVSAVHEGEIEPMLSDTLTQLGELINLAVAQCDLRQRLTEEHEQTAYLAYHDALTGLANRRFLEEELPKAMARARRNNQTLAVVMLDLDDFKPINDRWGHAVGDLLLKMLAERLTQALRGADLAVRQGGDEFILLIEGIERKTHLYQTLERLSQILSEPYALPAQDSIVQASLGVTLFPQDGAEPEQLLRHADAALYLAKSKKRNRKNSWHIWHDESDEALDTPTDTSASFTRTEPYGSAASALLQTFAENLPALVTSFVDFFYQELVVTDANAKKIITWLNHAEFLHLRQRQTEHLIALLKPDLTEAEHRAAARNVGTIHALIGVSASSLVRAITIYLHQFDELLARFRLSMQAHNQLEIVLTERLSVELAEELEADHLINQQYQMLLANVDALSRSTNLTWQDFNERMLNLICACAGIQSCWIGTPNADGEFIINFGAKIDAFTQAMKQHYGAVRMPSIASDQPHLQGTTARAFRLNQIQTLASFSTEPEAQPWREAALSIGIRSAISIPILDHQRRPIAVLSLYGGYPGQFETPFRQAFCQQLGFIASQTWQQLRQTDTLDMSIQELGHWQHAFYNQGITLHYQPIVNLGSGAIEKVEALTRLVLADGTVIMPSQFIARLNANQVIQLFREGLNQSLAQLTRWDKITGGATNHAPLGLALNLPLEALAAPECTHWVATALAQHRIAAHRLTLEVLEHHEIIDINRVTAQMQALAALGVSLAMDDLGAGYSGLIRLNNLPFDTVKIDQALICSVYNDPARIIPFIGALIQMTHALNLTVVCEGLESADLIEAVHLLGADRGQGYAIAHPVPPEQLAALLTPPRPLHGASAPRTALGALAALWQLIHSTQPKNRQDAVAPVSNQEHLATPNSVQQFIMNRGLEGGALDSTYQALQAVAFAHGWQSAECHQLLAQVQAYLAELVVKPEPTT